MTKKAQADPGNGLVAPGGTGKLEVKVKEGEKVGRTLARITLDPQTRNANLAMSFGAQMFGDQLKPELSESSAVFADEIQLTMKGDLSLASRIHTSQAMSLDALFTEMARRSGNNMGQYPDAAERYMRLVLKAQGANRLPILAGGVSAAASATGANRQACSRGGRRTSRRCRSFPSTHGGARKWKNNQTIRCNLPNWPKRRAA